MASKNRPDFRIVQGSPLPVSFLLPGMGAGIGSPSSGGLGAYKGLGLSPSQQKALTTGLGALAASQGINAPISALVSGLNADVPGILGGATGWLGANAAAQMGLGPYAGLIGNAIGGLVRGFSSDGGIAPKMDATMGALSSALASPLGPLGAFAAPLIGKVLEKTGIEDFIAKNIVAPLTGDYVNMTPGFDWKTIGTGFDLGSADFSLPPIIDFGNIGDNFSFTDYFSTPGVMNPSSLPSGLSLGDLGSGISMPSFDLGSLGGFGGISMPSLDFGSLGSLGDFSSPAGFSMGDLGGGLSGGGISLSFGW